MIEVLVVIAIIGLLSSIILVNLTESKSKARIARGLQFSQSVHHALGAYAVRIWDFNEIKDGNKVYESSGNNNHGTVYGATLVKSIPELGNALSFDGVDDYVDCGNDESLNITGPITVEIWVKRNSTDELTRRIVERAQWGPRRGYYLMTSVNKISFTVHYNDTLYVVISNSSFTVGVWTHLVGVYDGTKLKSYWNGVLERESNGPPQIDPTSAKKLIIGSEAGTGYYFDGLIDEVRIYSEALSTAEIQKHYAEGAKRHGIVFNEK